MLNKTNNHENSIYDAKFFTCIKEIKMPKAYKVVLRIFFALIVIFFFILLLPWRQFSTGYGVVTNLNPADRVQNITANVSGTLKWYVVDGQFVKKGQEIAEVVDNDKDAIFNIESENLALQNTYEAMMEVAKTSKINYIRQKELFELGIASRRDYEKATMEYKKASSEAQYYKSNLAKSNVNLARQKRQVIVSHADGNILRTISGSDSTIVKSGDTIATFSPNTADFIAEVYINGNDAPLINVGRKVRLQFEGWPAVQMSGWPTIAIGTFGGLVHFIDPMANKDGNYRVLIEQDPQDSPWPSSKFLRRGAKVNAWVLLDQVMFGFEIWRQFNGFPLSINYIKNIEPNFYQRNKEDYNVYHEAK